jgi:hypothetical protein
LKRIRVALGGILFLAAGLKIWLLWLDVVPFNADEAIVGLMARHILEGARPVFFYGQSYMGSLDAYLVAAGYSLFGVSVSLIRWVQLFLYLGTIITTVVIGRVGLGSWRTGLMAGLLLAVPSVNVTLYTTASLGGYGEALLIGNLILIVTILCHKLFEAKQMNRTLIGLGFLWGGLTGLGVWVNGLTLIYAVPTALFMTWQLFRLVQQREFRSLIQFALAVVVGVGLGALPYWLYALENGWGYLLAELFGSAVSVEREGWLLRAGLHLRNLVLLGGTAIFGMRPPWEVRWLAVPMMPFALAFWLGVLIYWVRLLGNRSLWLSNDESGSLSDARKATHKILSGMVLVLLAGFIFTSFGVDPSGRYFVPLVVPMALFAAEFVQVRTKSLKIQMGILLVPLVFNLWGTIESGLRYPPGLTTQFDGKTLVDHRYDAELIQFLIEEEETIGYTNYWIAYPLAFLSGEELIFVPRLPYHVDMRYTPRDDRYASYGMQVDQSVQAAYITSRTPKLDAYLRSAFTENGVTWQEAVFGDYQVFYALSKHIRVEQIGLGSAYP